MPIGQAAFGLHALSAPDLFHLFLIKKLNEDSDPQSTPSFKSNAPSETSVGKLQQLIFLTTKDILPQKYGFPQDKRERNKIVVVCETIKNTLILIEIPAGYNNIE